MEKRSGRRWIDGTGRLRVGSLGREAVGRCRFVHRDRRGPCKRAGLDGREKRTRFGSTRWRGRFFLLPQGRCPWRRHWRCGQQDERQCKVKAIAGDGDGEAGWARHEGGRRGRRGSHQQTRFSASTIADNDQLSTEFGHFEESVWFGWMQAMEVKRKGSVVELWE